jgi:predicted dinucleotide-binding enzyme
MKIGIIGGGGVAQTLGAGLIGLGHSVQIGLRQVNDAELAKPHGSAQSLADWSARTGGQIVTLAQAAAQAELVINATTAQGTLDALKGAGAENLAGKILLDLSNPLDFSRGMPPALFPEYSGHTSLGEQVQAAFPAARVVKAFNTIAAAVMVDPGLIKGDHDFFLAGNDDEAKSTVTALARALGWVHVVDLGDITGARALEGLIVFWIRLMMTGGPITNIHVLRG